MKQNDIVSVTRADVTAFRDVPKRRKLEDLLLIRSIRDVTISPADYQLIHKVFLEVDEVLKGKCTIKLAPIVSDFVKAATKKTAA
jgi:hypothetical protein